MEEILASIRRIVADDPSGVSPLIDLNRKPMDRNTASGSDGVGADDSPDFELPSMFRPENGSAQNGSRAKAKSAPIGRLTDAIRNVGPKVVAVGNARHNLRSQSSGPQLANGTPQAVQSKTTQQDQGGFGIRPKPTQSLSSLTANGGAAQPLRNGNGSTVQPGTRSGPTPINNGLSEAPQDPNGSSPDLNVVHHNSQPEPTPETHPASGATSSATPSHVQETPQSSVFQSAGVKKTGASTPRVMAPFRDTRMSMMGPTAGAKPAQKIQSEPKQSDTMQAAQPQTTAAPRSGIGAIVPGALGLPGRGPAVADGINGSQEATSAQTPVQQGTPPNSNQVADPSQEPQSSSQAAELEPNPPPLPSASEAGASPQIEDATADLLRPMLRQWLTDNMPRMVEKALHIEVAETVRTGKPTESS